MLLRHQILSQPHIFVQMELTAQVYAGPKSHAHDRNLHHRQLRMFNVAPLVKMIQLRDFFL